MGDPDWKNFAHIPSIQSTLDWNPDFQILKTYWNILGLIGYPSGSSGMLFSYYHATYSHFMIVKKKQFQIGDSSSIKSPLQDYTQAFKKGTRNKTVARSRNINSIQSLSIILIFSKTNPYREYQSFLIPILIWNTNPNQEYQSSSDITIRSNPYR